MDQLRISPVLEKHPVGEERIVDEGSTSIVTNADNEYETGEAELHFELRLLVKHPSMDLSVLTGILGLAPNLTWLAGSKRAAPNGQPLPGTYRESAWQCSRRIEGQRDFAKQVVDLTQHLQIHRDFLMELVNKGAVITILIDLSGSRNIGAVFDWPDLKTIADLRINLSIEVFPIYD